MDPYAYAELLPPMDPALPAETGERRLLAAVLRRALDDFAEHGTTWDRHSGLLSDSAARWIFQPPPDNAQPHLSFEEVCDALGLDPQYVQRLARGLKNRPRRRNRAA